MRIKPYYQDKWVTIYHGDCRDILPLTPEKSIDLVLTDPPYGVNYMRAEWDTEDFGSIMDWLTPFILRLLGDGCHWFSWCPNSAIADDRFKGIFIAGKNWGQYRADVHWLDCWSPIGVIVNGKPRTNIKGNKNYFEGNTASTAKNAMSNYRRFNHQTPKSEDVSNYIIDGWSNPHELILDPFLGSGTTAYCAKKLNRKCIGIEIKEKYCEIAAKRCSQGVFDFGLR